VGLTGRGANWRSINFNIKEGLTGRS